MASSASAASAEASLSPLRSRTPGHGGGTSSGHAAIADDGSVVAANDFRAQAEQTFDNLRRTLEAAGSSLDKVLKVTIFLRDMATNFPTVIEMRERFFTCPYPADTVVEIVSLGLPELMIEIEAIAAI